MPREIGPMMNKEPYLIASYAGKGGVAKTTSIYEIAADLARQNHKLLMIDADAQTNLTSRVYGGILTRVDDEYTNHRTLASDTTQWSQDRAQHQTRRTIYHVVSDIDPSFDDYDRDRGAKAPNLNTIADEVEPITLPYAVGTTQRNIRFIPCSADRGLKRIQRKMPAIGTQDSGPMRHVNERITQSFRQIARKQNYDIVLIDLSSAEDNWNASILMGVDNIYIPVLPDVYSTQTLPQTLDFLMEEVNGLRDGSSQAPGMIDESYGPFGRPKLGGVLLQMSRGQKGRRQPSLNNPEEPNPELEDLYNAYSQWREKIFERLQSKLGQVRDAGLLADPDGRICIWAPQHAGLGSFLNARDHSLSANRHAHTLPEGVKDFLSLGKYAQTLGIPFFDLKAILDFKPSGDTDDKVDLLRRTTIIETNKFHRNNTYNNIVKGLRKQTHILKKNGGQRFPVASAQRSVPREVFQANPQPLIGWYSSEMVDEAIKFYGTQDVENRELAIQTIELGVIRWQTADVGTVFGLTVAQTSLMSFRDELYNRLRDHIEQYPNCDLFLPCVTGGHFTLISCQPPRLGASWRLQFFDPLGSSSAQANFSQFSQINRVVNMLGDELNISIDRPEFNRLSVQSDSYNCGAWIVEAFRIARTRDNRLPLDNDQIQQFKRTTNIAQRREDHRAALPQVFDSYLSGNQPRQRQQRSHSPGEQSASSMTSSLVHSSATRLMARAHGASAASASANSGSYGLSGQNLFEDPPRKRQRTDESRSFSPVSHSSTEEPADETQASRRRRTPS